MKNIRGGGMSRSQCHDSMNLTAGLRRATAIRDKAIYCDLSLTKPTQHFMQKMANQ